MFKEDAVRDWARGVFSSRPYRSFTAGEAARESGVSRNTAKKYLDKMAREDLGLYSWLYQMNNGLVATLYSFTNVRED